MGTNSPEGGDFGHNLTETRQARRKGAENKKDNDGKSATKAGSCFLLPRFYGKKKGIEILKTRTLDVFNVNKQFNSVISWVLVWK
jgi:hypothetical protein